MTGNGRIFTVGPNQGEAMFVLGDVVTFKIMGEESDHAYFLTEIRSLPGGGPAFLHTHVPQETFWILEGEYEVYGQDTDGEKYAIEATVGSTVHVPGNVPHGFKNVGETHGRLLALYAPVVHQTEFFREIGVAMESTLSDMPFDQFPSNEHILEVLAKHQMKLLEPLPEG
ncbi:MAG TPA: cupin domain-containing protein [Acidimicrobiia bacterium]|nr:cupin domain-containing protein [Acidimicrobiia bacterium]